MATENQVVLNSKVQLRNDTSANWKSTNPILLKGEVGIEFDTEKIKIGDGTTAWNELEYFGNYVEKKTEAPKTSDIDYEVGTLWLDTSNGGLYILVAKATTATWLRLVVSNEIGVVAEATTAQKLKNARTIAITGDGSASTTFDGSANATLSFVLANTGVSAGTYTKFTVNAKGLITKAELLKADDIPTIPTSKVSGLGSAATKNVGTSAGNVVAVGSDGKIAESLLPALAITDTFAVANESEMLALNAQVGDIAVRADISKSFILKSSPANVVGNWLELKSPDCKVISVNGKTGAVVLSTSDIAEGVNLYFTEQRATANFEKNYKAKSSTDLKDGATILHSNDTLVLNGGNA